MPNAVSGAYTVSEAVEVCKLFTRRKSWLTDADWITLLDAAAKDIARQTDILRGFAQLEMDAGYAEYDLSAGRVYRLLADPVYYDGSTLTRTTVEKLIAAGTDLTLTGIPSTVYPSGSFALGVYPVPDSSETGHRMRLWGVLAPEPIVSGMGELPFEPVDHLTLIQGAVIMGERLDDGIIISRDTKVEYETSVMSMRGRANRRVPGVAKVMPGGR
jgi:hypothetical protein